MTDRELMQQALAALEHAMRYWDYRHITAALRERVAQPEQPQWHMAGFSTPPRRELAGLTDRDIEEIARYQDEHGSGPWHMAFARAIEAKLKERNQ